jgi:hypothetical protein
MPKSKNHNLLFVRGRISEKTGLMPIGIKGFHGSQKIGETTLDIKIPENAWNDDSRLIKENFRHKLKHEYNKLNTYNERRIEARDKLAEGEWDFDLCVKHIKKQPDEIVDEIILDFVNEQKPNNERQYSTLKKHRANLNRVNTYLAEHLPKYSPLRFSHIQKSKVCELIEETILNEREWKSSYKKSLLTSIETFWKKKYNKEVPLFKNKPPDNSNPTPKTPVTQNSFIDGLANVRTLYQLEAFLFWLYSLSMLGLDGIDLLDLDESNVVSDVDSWDYYHPSVDYSFGEKIHVGVVRSKQSNLNTAGILKDEDEYISMTRLWNLYPIKYIHSLLRHCIRINHPDIAYTGKDRIRLFNFKVRDKNRMQIPENYNKWEALRKSYGKALKKKMGATVQFTRSTSTSLGVQTGVSEIQLDTFLLHSNQPSKSLKHYLSEYQIKADTDHIFILKEFDINHKIQSIIKKFKNKTTIINNKVHKFIPDELMPDSENIDMNLNIKFANNLMYEPLTIWSQGEEIEFQKYTQMIQEGKSEIDDEGKSIRVYLKPDDYPEEYKELIKKKYANQLKEIEKHYKILEK